MDEDVPERSPIVKTAHAGTCVLRSLRHESERDKRIFVRLFVSTTHK
jgi:hypothetical protein